MLTVQTDAQKNRFLNSIAALGNVKRASEETGIRAATHYGWLRNDPAYAAAYQDAALEAAENLEAEAYRRAHDGVDEAVWYQGVQVGTVRKYSDGLLQFLLKGRNPSVFGDKLKQELVSVNLNASPIDLSRLSAEELDEFEALAKKASRE